ncbi:MAG TPA: GNAT family N-acetyltransferase [Candidatus Acidoferrales bacterium]|nr:GNAT family N-acetyltransferase [Candidatus Acidoferrales bacterium]
MANEAPTNLTIRKATDADIDALTGMMVAFRDYLEQTSPSEFQFAQALRLLLHEPATDFLVASRNGMTVGFAQCRYRHSAWADGLEVELEDLWIAPQARRQGAGLQLMTAVFEHAARRGCRAIVVATNERNEAALALYRRVGFACERQRWNDGRQLMLQRLLIDRT